MDELRSISRRRSKLLAEVRWDYKQMAQVTPVPMVYMDPIGKTSLGASAIYSEITVELQVSSQLLRVPNSPVGFLDEMW